MTEGRIVLLDGATGTELQRRGVAMDKIAWSGAAVLTHPQTVREVHEDYIRAGAEVVISNTFGSTRQMLAPAGYGDRVEEVNRLGVELAIDANRRLGAAADVAGSIAAMPPNFDRANYLSPADELAAYREATCALADAGADLIALEMMEDTEHAARAMQAAKETGLPVWLGVSCKHADDGRLVGFGYQDTTLDEVLDALLPFRPDAVNIMHTNVHLVSAALRTVRARWDGIVGVYPESGYFKSPNWQFVDVISPADLVVESQRWIQEGVTMVGGCCGTGVEHIQALREALEYRSQRADW